MMFIVKVVFPQCSLKLDFFISTDRGDPAFLDRGTLSGGHTGQCKFCLSLFCENNITLSQKHKYDCCKCLEALNGDWHHKGMLYLMFCIRILPIKL